MEFSIKLHYEKDKFNYLKKIVFRPEGGFCLSKQNADTDEMLNYMAFHLCFIAVCQSSCFGSFSRQMFNADLFYARIPGANFINEFTTCFCLKTIVRSSYVKNRVSSNY